MRCPAYEPLKLGSKDEPPAAVVGGVQDLGKGAVSKAKVQSKDCKSQNQQQPYTLHAITSCQKSYSPTVRNISLYTALKICYIILIVKGAYGSGVPKKVEMRRSNSNYVNRIMNKTGV